jgi:hypothetical protein
LGAAALAFSVLLVAPAGAADPPSHTCAGTVKAPGALTGTLTGDVVVRGVCFVNAGPAIVNGDVTLTSGAVLVATSALNDQTHSGTSSLTVSGDVVLDHRATLIMGCLPTSSPCMDDPHPHHPTLSSHDEIGGDIISDRGLGTIVHNTTIHGDITQLGGGGGINCNPTGVFNLLHSPVFSTYEDSTVDGNITITGYKSCWQGVARVHVRGDLVVSNNQLADPDAIEIVSNHVTGDLICHANSMVWDSGEAGPHGLFPRIPQPDTVHGDREGQCVLSSPTSPGGPPGPGPF